MERCHAQKATLAGCTDLPSRETGRFGHRCYLVSNRPYTGDACVIREYTTFLGELKVDVWIRMQDMSQVDASDELLPRWASQSRGCRGRVLVLQTRGG